jgi:hypothetical protein
MHSKLIKFIHPFSGKEMSFEAGYPKDFNVLIKVLRKYKKNIGTRNP